MIFILNYKTPLCTDLFFSLICTAFYHTIWASQLALVVKKLPTNAGDVRDTGLIPGSGRSPGGGCCNPLQYSCQENPMDGGTWQATVDRVTKSQTWMKWISMQILLYITGVSTQLNVHPWRQATCLFSPFIFVYLLEEAIKNAWSAVDLWAGPGRLEAPHPLPVLGMCFHLAFPTPKSCSKHSTLK